MAELFRKSVLEKLSSPEQLDRAVVITPPSFWIAMMGGAVIIAGALLWGIFGRLPVNVDTSGIFISGDGTNSVYTEVSGVVSEVTAKVGEKIEKGDVVAYVSDSDITAEIQSLSNRIEAVEKVTLESENDTATADNKAMIDLKTELLSLTSTYKQSKKSLIQKQEELKKQKAVVKQLKETADAAKTAYYNSVKSGVDSASQLNYSEAQSEYTMRQQYYESAYSACQQAGSAVEQARSAYAAAFDQAYAALDSANAAYAVYENVEAQYQAQTQAVENLIASGASQEEIQGAQLQADNLQQQSQGAYTDYQNKNATYESLHAAQQQTEVNLSSAETTYQQAVDSLQNAESNLYSAKSKFESAKSSYTATMNAQQAQSGNQSTLSNEYSQALSEYNTEKSLLESLEQTVDSLTTQTDQAKDNMKVQKKQIKASFASARESALSQLNEELSKYIKNQKKYEILSTQEGIIQEIVTVQGMIVGQGSEILKVKQGEAGKQEVLCYMSVSTGKKVVPGMEVMIYPTTVNEQEYGHMSGTVKSVADYVTSQSEMKKRLGDDTLVNAFLQSGPVVEVVCTVKEDPGTASGYYWSSKKGKDITLTEGTMLEAKIITEKKAPITMLLPYLKEKLSNLGNPKNTASGTAAQSSAS